MFGSIKILIVSEEDESVECFVIFRLIKKLEEKMWDLLKKIDLSPQRIVQRKDECPLGRLRQD